MWDLHLHCLSVRSTSYIDKLRYHRNYWSSLIPSIIRVIYWIYNWTLTIENKYIDKLETYVCLISIWRPTKISKWVRIETFQDGRNTILVHEQKYYFFIFHFTITSCKSFASCKERFMVSIPSLSSFVIFEAIWKLRFVYFSIEVKILNNLSLTWVQNEV